MECSSWVLFLAANKPVVLAHVYNKGTPEVGGGSGVQGHPRLMSSRPAWIRLARVCACTDTHTHTHRKESSPRELSNICGCSFLPLMANIYAEASLLDHSPGPLTQIWLLTLLNHFHVAKVSQMVSTKKRKCQLLHPLTPIVALVFKSKSPQHNAHLHGERLVFSRGISFFCLGQEKCFGGDTFQDVDD